MTDENLPAMPEEEVKAILKSDTSLFFDVAKFEHAQRVAKVFAASTMVPDHFKDNIGNCVIALNLANRMQCDPFMLMQNMYIVHGKPGIEAKLAIALVNNLGKFTPLQFQYNDSKTSCYAYAKRLDTGEICKGVEITMEMAQAEGWISKPGSKWKTMPDLMLTYRSAMFFARIYCPEALLGMQTREELYDTVELEKSASGGYVPVEILSTEQLTEKIKTENKGKNGDQISEIDADLGKANDGNWIFDAKSEPPAGLFHGPGMPKRLEPGQDEPYPPESEKIEKKSESDKFYEKAYQDDPKNSNDQIVQAELPDPTDFKQYNCKRDLDGIIKYLKIHASKFFAQPDRMEEAKNWFERRFPDQKFPLAALQGEEFEAPEGKEKIETKEKPKLNEELAQAKAQILAIRDEDPKGLAKICRITGISMSPPTIQGCDKLLDEYWKMKRKENGV